LALAVPLSRFTSRVGGGSAFYVRRHHTSHTNKTQITMTNWHPKTPGAWRAVLFLLVIATLIPELLLGSTPLSRSYQLVFELPYYGSAALVIREAVIRLKLIYMEGEIVHCLAEAIDNQWTTQTQALIAPRRLGCKIAAHYNVIRILRR